jgi:hypothetical protein
MICASPRNKKTTLVFYIKPKNHNYPKTNGKKSSSAPVNHNIVEKTVNIEAIKNQKLQRNITEEKKKNIPNTPADYVLSNQLKNPVQSKVNHSSDYNGDNPIIIEDRMQQNQDNNQLEQTKTNNQTKEEKQKRKRENDKAKNPTEDYKVLIADQAYNIFKEKNNLEKKDALRILDLLLYDLSKYYKEKTKSIGIKLSIIMNSVHYPFLENIIFFDKSIKETFKVRYSQLLSSILTDMHYMISEKKTINPNNPWIEVIRQYISAENYGNNTLCNSNGKEFLEKFMSIFSNNIYLLLEERIIEMMMDTICSQNEREDAINNKNNKALNYATISVRHGAKKENLITEIHKKFLTQVDNILKSRLCKVPVLFIKTKSSWDAITISNNLEKKIEMNTIMKNFSKYPIDELKEKIKKLFSGEVHIEVRELDTDMLHNVSMVGGESVWHTYDSFLNTNNKKAILCLIKNNISKEFKPVVLEEIVYGKTSQWESLQKNNDNQDDNRTIEYEIYIFPKVMYISPLYDQSVPQNHGCFTFLSSAKLNKMKKSPKWTKIQMGFIAVELEKLLKHIIYDCNFTPIELSGKKENVVILNKNLMFSLLEFRIEEDDSVFTTLLENFVQQIG